MAFPVYTKVLADNFNRSDEEPATGWTDFEAAGMRIVSNALAPGVGGGGAFWAANPTLGDFEAYVVAATPTTADSYLSWRRNGGTGAGYGIFLGNGDVNRYDPATTLLGNISSALPLVAGDELAIQHIGAALAIWKKPFGEWWQLLITLTDGTYPSGQFAIAEYSTCTWKQFSLGTSLLYEPTLRLPPMRGRRTAWG